MRKVAMGRRLITVSECLLTLIPFWIPVADARHFKVYGTATLDAEEVELVYWADYVAQSSSDMDFFGNAVERERLWAHSVEIEYGATDRATIAVYADFEQPTGSNLKYIQTRVGGRYRFGDAGLRAFDSALYLEYYLPDPGYQGAGEAIEVRLLLEKDIGATNIRINPKIEKKMSGPDVEEGAEFEYGISLYRPVTADFNMGLELYGALGELVNTKSFDQQQHYIVPAMSLDLIDHLSWNVGVAFGITDAADDMVFKSVLEWEL